MQKDISLRFFTDDDLPRVEAYYLTEEDVYFTSPTSEVLETCRANPDCRMVLIMRREDVVGLFVLRFGSVIERHTSNPRALGLFSFSIDSREKGKGIASRAVKLLGRFIRENFSDVDEVLLGVNVKNPAAERAYLNGGFVDTGRKFKGEIGYQKLFSMTI